jgi:hypothetical protein
MAVGVTTFRGRTALGGAPQIMGAGLPLILGDDPTGGTGLTEETSGSGSSGLGSILSGQAAKRRAELEALKLKNEQEAAAAAIQRQITGAQNQANYLRSQIGAGIPAVTLENIGGQETAGQNYINTQYTNLLADLTGRRDTGSRLTTQGYDALRNYLASNVPQAYATAAQGVPTSTQNALAAYMQGQGVDTAATQSAVDTANAQGMGGATNYTQLLNVLRAQEASGQQSRMSEEQMARTLAGANLEAIYGQGTAGLEQQKLASLNELATRISNARLQAQQLQTARDQALQDALAALYGTGYVAPTETAPGEPVVDPVVPVVPVTPPGQGGGVKTSPSVAALAAIPVKASNTALQNRIDAFVAAKPRASAAAVAKEFPQLAAAIAKKKK